MAITAYVGLPGHGKSYGVVENVIIPALKSKRVVFTNIPMHDDICLQDFGMTVVPFVTDDIIKNPNWFKTVFQAGAILVWDELWRALPTGVQAAQIAPHYKEFFAEHRHMVGDDGFSTDICIVTQDLSQISNFVRALVETTFRVVKLVNMGLSTRFRVDVYSGAVTGSRPPASKLDRQIFGGKFKKEIYKFYKSHTKSQTGEAGDESKTDNRGSALKRLSIKLGFVAFIVFIPFIYFGLMRVKAQYSAPAPALVPDSLPSVSPKQPFKPSDKQPVIAREGQIYTSQTQRSPVDASVQKNPNAPKFLASAKSFYISHSITSAGKQTWFYKVVFNDTEVVLSEQELRRVGYALMRVNDCLVKVTGADYAGFIMCPKPARRDSGSGLIAGLSNDISGAVTPAVPPK